MLKRFTALFLSVILSFAFCSCQDDKTVTSSNNTLEQSSIVVNTTSYSSSFDESDLIESQTQTSDSSEQASTSLEQASTSSERVSTSSNISSSNNSSEQTVTSTKIPTASMGTDETDPENRPSSHNYGQPYDTDFFNPTNIKAKGIDVSKWQGRIDWRLVAKDNIDFAMVRIGYRAENGKIYKDDTADYNIQQALKNGLLVGAYFFSTAKNTTEAKEEALWTMEQIKGYSISYPVAFDCEGFENSDSRMYNLTSDERTNNAIAFLKEIKASGYEPMFYYSSKGNWDIEKLEKSYKIWYPNYNLIKSDPERLYYDGRCDIWQYTNTGEVDGIESAVDLNVAYFKPKKATPKDPNAIIEEAKEPKSFSEMEFESVEEEVTAKDEVYLRDGPSIAYRVRGTLKNGDTLYRIGISEKGWSMLMYNGRKVYAVSSYLTTDLLYNKPDEPDIVEGNTFTPQRDIVTAKDMVNLRKKPTTDSAIVGVMYNGDTLSRTAISDKGWSRLNYDGKTVYAVTSYLTTDLNKASSEHAEEPNFHEENKQVTAKIEVNLRDEPNTSSSKIVCLLKNGEYVKCVGVYDNGWSKLEYNGQTVYAVTSYLEEKK